MFMKKKFINVYYTTYLLQCLCVPIATRAWANICSSFSSFISPKPGVQSRAICVTVCALSIVHIFLFLLFDPLLAYCIYFILL